MASIVLVFPGDPASLQLPRRIAMHAFPEPPTKVRLRDEIGTYKRLRKPAYSRNVAVVANNTSRMTPCVLTLAMFE